MRAQLSGASRGAGLLEVQAIDDSAKAFENEPDRNHTVAMWGLYGGSPQADVKWNND